MSDCKHEKLRFIEEATGITCNDCGAMWDYRNNTCVSKSAYGNRISANYYCSCFFKWADMNKKKFGEEFEEAFNLVYRYISKSCLLDRMIYGLEQPLPNQCPVHKGHWGGVTWPKCEHCGGACGCNTGWTK